MKKTWSIVTWVATLLFTGDPEAWAKFHVSMGCKAVMFKFGNGYYPWEGLDLYVAAARRHGLEVWAWWYLYGSHKLEGEIIGKAAAALGLDGVALDVEREWERGAGWTQAGRETTAKRTMDGIRKYYTGLLALCSWWHVEGNPKVPYKVFLDGCDFNMPQLYWIGRWSVKSALDVIDRSMEMYGRLFNWPASKTIPVLASFGQTYGSKGTFWKATIPQMQATMDRCIEMGCPGVQWYSMDYLLGGAGHEAPKGIPEHAMLDLIRASNAGNNPPPPPPPDLLPIELRYPSSKVNLTLTTTD